MTVDVVGGNPLPPEAPDATSGLPGASAGSVAGGLRYAGGDPAHRWLPGVPARDLTAADLADLAGFTVEALVASGLYERS